MKIISEKRIDVPGHSLAVTYGKLVAVSVIWGGTFVAGRFLSHDVAPLLAATVRFFLASIALLLFIASSRAPFELPRARQLFVLLCLGFFGIFVYNLCFFYGLRYVSASRASLIVALNPAVMGLASHIVFKEKTTSQRIGGIALCLLGAAMVILNGQGRIVAASSTFWPGDLLIFGCVVSWVIYSVFSKKIAQEIGSLNTVAWSVVFGTLMLICASAGLGQLTFTKLLSIRTPAFVSLLYLGIIGSAVAYVWYYDGIKRIGATRAGVFIALNPMTAVLLGAMLLEERLHPATLAGGGIIIVGIYLCNRRDALRSGASREAGAIRREEGSRQ